MTYLGRDAVIQHALVETQVYMSWLGRSYSTCPGCDAVLRHALVRMQCFDMPWLGSSTTCLEETPFLRVVGHFRLTFWTCLFTK